jgi:hypothetical protein
MTTEQILNYFEFIDTRNMTIKQFINYLAGNKDEYSYNSEYSLTVKIPNNIIIEDLNGNQLYYGPVNDNLISDLYTNKLFTFDVQYKFCINDKVFDDLEIALSNINWFDSQIPIIKFIKLNINKINYNFKLYIDCISIVNKILNNNNIKLEKIMIGNMYFFYPEYYLPYLCTKNNINEYNKINNIQFQILN